MNQTDQIDADWFSKPGESILALMQQHGVSIDDLAPELSVDRSDLRKVLNGSIEIDQKFASALADKLGGSSQFWLNRQQNYSIALENAVGRELTFNPEEWLDKVPDPAPRKVKDLNAGELRNELRRRMNYFNVPTFDAWENRYGNLVNETSFRTSPSFHSLSASDLLWLRQGEIESELISTEKWDKNKLCGSIPEIRKLTCISRPSRFLPLLRQICANSGVAMVVVKAPKGCTASGAVHKIGSNKMMLLLSFRYLADDQFWFTVFHELGHLILHESETQFYTGDKTVEASEQEADEFAARAIIPEQALNRFNSLKYKRNEILRFAVSIGVSAGLVVGQMQHRDNEFRKMNGLKRRWKWSEIEYCNISD